MEQFKMITKENDLAQSLITAMLTERIQPYIPHWDKHGIDIPVFYIAGGALWDSPPNDIDVYLPQGTSFSSMVNKIFEITSKEMSEKSVTKSVHSSPNALTLRLSEIKVPVQICSYQKPSIKELADSFDFSHTQSAVEITDGKVTSVYYSDAWLKARLTGKTEYMGTDYPLSSLIRLNKYHRRGLLTTFQRNCSTIRILASIIDRGFQDYKDFKDQLESLDIAALTKEEYAQERDALMKIFDKLVKK